MSNSSRFEGWSRRAIIQAIGGSMFATVAPRLVRASDSQRFKRNPFGLGIASGSPTQTGMVLWTRLVDESLGTLAIPVQWELAADDKMTKIVQRGTFMASSQWAHSVHVEVGGLRAGRDYWYRFFVGEHATAIGRTRTLPNAAARPERLRIAVASCQKFENGFYTAYRHMLNEDLDLVMHVGDYIYEGTGGADLVRGNGADETFTLDDYRARYALYKSDADLQAMHAAHAWLMTWDDHEVVNDYAGDTSYDMSGAVFLARRAAAYRAYYEHMPLPKSAIPLGPNMRLYARFDYGNLARIHMLDSRQYRSPLGCMGDEDTGGPGASCASLFNSTRTKLGAQQEAWLSENLSKSAARWNVSAWGTPIAHVDLDPGPGVAYRRDSWDGYPAARQRFLDTLTKTRPNNPVVIDGDIHAFQVANLNKQANDVTTPVIASEFTTTSITSPGVSQRALDERRKWNPNVLLSDASRHGYLLMDFAREHLRTDLVTVDTIKKQDAARGVLASFAVENGKPGPIAA